jgi:HPt (histidine-containing phosphotransfer) domain-containing protein
MDGYTTTRLIRQNPRWASLPIIALTAGAFESFKTAAYEAGMNEFISKPFNIEQLLSTIQNHTGNVQRTTSLPQNKINQLEKSPSIHLALPGIDVQKGLKLWGDEAVYQKFLAKFINSYKDAGNEIAQLLRLNDNFAASALTHKLKGVSGSLALTDVEQIVHQLDELFQTGIPLIETAESLQKAIDEVGVSIAQWKSYRF